MVRVSARDSAHVQNKQYMLEIYLSTVEATYQCFHFFPHGMSLLKIRNALFVAETRYLAAQKYVFQNPIPKFDIEAPGTGAGKAFYAITGPQKLNFLNVVAENTFQNRRLAECTHSLMIYTAVTRSSILTLRRTLVLIRSIWLQDMSHIHTRAS